MRTLPAKHGPRLRCACSILALAWIGACEGPARNGDPDGLTEDQRTTIDAIVESARQERGISGVSIAVLRGDRLVLARGYGLANRGDARAPAVDTVYPIGSISKQFTAAAIMRLVEDGRVDLDRPIGDYLPDAPFGDDPPLVRHLLAQTSGVPDDDLPELDAIDPETLDEVIEVIARQPLRFAPGERWAYSNSNYTLLAAIVESVTGQAHDDFLAQELLEPLQLDATSSILELAPSPRVATGYANESGDFTVDDLAPDRVSYIGNGGLASSAEDLARWMRALVDGRAVSAESFRRMTTPPPVAAGYTPRYGFGLSLVAVAERRCISHTGVTDGYTTAVAAFPDDDLVVAVLTNARHLWITEILAPVARVLLGRPRPEILDLHLPTEVAEAFEGTYDDGLFELVIRRDGDHLILEVDAFGPPMKLLYQGRRHFVSEQEPDSIRLRFDRREGPARRVAFEWLEIRSFGERVDTRPEPSPELPEGVTR